MVRSSYGQKITHPYCPSVWSFSSYDVQFKAGREHSFPADVVLHSDISARFSAYGVEYIHVETGDGMVQFEESIYATVKEDKMADKETGRTVIVKKEGRIMPVDHCIDGRPEKVEKRHSGEDTYIGPLIVAGECRSMTWTGDDNLQF